MTKEEFERKWKEQDIFNPPSTLTFPILGEDESFLTENNELKLWDVRGDLGAFWHNCHNNKEDVEYELEEILLLKEFYEDYINNVDSWGEENE